MEQGETHRVVTGVLTRDGKALLGLRSARKRWYPSVWDLPGGHVELGETPIAALVRELHEELGIWVELPPWEVSVAALYLPGGGEAPAVALEIWHITGWDGEIRNVAPWEHEELAFFTADDLASLRLAHTGLARIVTSCLGAERA